MNQTNGNKIKALFNACIDLPHSEQISFINASDYSDEIKQKVLKLINYSGDIDAELSQVILDTAQQGLEHHSIKKGEKIDQYKMVNKVGEGGQGEVWLATRDDGEFNHQVAIKFIKTSATEKELQRFQNERELLASLQHPNVSALIGGGQHQGRLYMIMEWVEGVGLFSYLKKAKLHLKDTLKFFLQICHAVSYAHSKGIIHRDIKPSNIMVTTDGLVKLLDFGIAKPIDAELTQTQSDAMMTFAYSSPEQIRGDSITTATDVYALGLVLYELLTSQVAQSRTTESPAEYIHIITDVTPLKPSVQVTKHVHDNRHFNAKVLQGDLDNLVMMCIRKEIDRRYKNADEVINDVSNYLQSRPLLASGDSTLYKVGKLLKRNPLASILTAAVLTFLIVLPVLMYQNGLQLKQERDRAKEQALIANKTTEFLTTLFEATSPLGHNGEPIDLNSVMAQGERQLNLDVDQQPQVVAALSNEFAQIYHHLENTPKSITYYQKAIASYKQAGDQQGLLAAQGQLALMYFRNDQLDKSDEVFKQADVTASLMPNSRETVLHMTRKATVETERGEREKAAWVIEKAFNNLSSAHHQDDEVMGRLYHVWGEAIKYSDQVKALEFAEKSAHHVKQQLGTTVHPFYLQRINSQAVRLKRLNRHEEAKIVLDEVLKISEALYSKDHPKYASNLSEKGGFLHDLGYFSEAEKIYTQSLDIYRNHYGENNFETARMINNLAYLYEDMSLYQKAKPLYERSVELRYELDPKNTIRVATSKSNLARLLTKMNEYQRSEILLDELMPIYESHNRKNLYNEITRFANMVGDGGSVQSCENALKMLQVIEPELAKESAKGWRRLGAEVWISQLLKKCNNEELAKQWLLAAVDKSIDVYQADSEGFQYIQITLSDWGLN